MCVCVFDTLTKDADAQTHAHTHKNTGAYIAGALSFFGSTRSNKVPCISELIYIHMYIAVFSSFFRAHHQDTRIVQQKGPMPAK